MVSIPVPLSAVPAMAATTVERLAKDTPVMPRVVKSEGAKPGASPPNRFYMYGVIARLAMLAASYELEATDPEAEVYE